MGKPVVDTTTAEFDAGVREFFEDYAMPLLRVVSGAASPGSSLDVENGMMQMCERLFKSDVRRVAETVSRTIPDMVKEMAPDTADADRLRQTHTLTALSMGIMIGMLVEQNRE